MIIDLILDRKDGIFYNPSDFYIGVASYAETASDIAQRIAEAMDGGEEADVQRELCAYIAANNYDPEICEYIKSVKWLEKDAEQLNPICVDCKRRGSTCSGTTCQAWTGCVYRK